MYFSVKHVEAKRDYTLLLTFADGQRRRFDMKPYLDVGVFRELRDGRLFRTVHVSFNTIAWDNNADFDPEVLYQKSEPME